MDRTSRTHFGMDERGLGGTYMIQQQFLHMYRRIQSAQKQIDNDPPNTSNFKRPAYSTKFGDYWRRVQPAELQVEGRVDHDPPASFPLLEGLYINQPLSGRGRSAGSKKHQEAANRQAHNCRQVADEDLLHAAEIEGIDVTTMPASMISYLISIHKRRKVVAEELAEIRRRRLLHGEDQNKATPHLLHGTQDSVGGHMIAALARDTLRSLEACAQPAPSGGTLLHAEVPILSAQSITFNESTADTERDGKITAADTMLQPLNSLVLRSPEYVGDGTHRSLGSTDRRASTISGAGAASSPSFRRTPSSVGSHKHLEHSKSKTSLGQLDPQLLAASAPKKIVLKRTPRGTGSDDWHSPNTDAQSLAPRPPSGGQQARKGTQAFQSRVVSAPHRVAVADSSMAGREFTVLSASGMSGIGGGNGPTAAPRKVVGLVNCYDGEDAATCDDHHM